MKFKNLPLVKSLLNHLGRYPTPINLNYLFSFGAITGLFLSMQLITGILLAIYYTPHILLAFTSVEHIIRDISFGWLLRYIHANGASFFFIIVYVHILKNIYYKSYYNPRIFLWLSGIGLFVLIIATAFIGYVLPWGQISFWGATVITNLFSVIPIIGPDLAQWLWGGFTVDNATLNRFFSLHYLLPFVILSLVLVHIILLHYYGSNHPIGTEFSDKIIFYPYFYLKDLFLFIVILSVFSYIVCFYPNLLGHVDNYIIANSLVTPTHIVPEWYFLIYYAILRAIPNKIGGVLVIVGALLLLIFIVFSLRFLLFKSFEIRIPSIFKFQKYIFWGFVINLSLLGWIGSQVIEFPFTKIGMITTFNYFIFIILVYLIIPVISELFIACFIQNSNDNVNKLTVDWVAIYGTLGTIIVLAWFIVPFYDLLQNYPKIDGLPQHEWKPFEPDIVKKLNRFYRVSELIHPLLTNSNGLRTLHDIYETQIKILVINGKPFDTPIFQILDIINITVYDLRTYPNANTVCSECLRVKTDKEYHFQPQIIKAVVKEIIKPKPFVFEDLIN
jgi:quinol-cytochrome oxidoreductase complex cytochrome b subunit